MSDLPDQVSRGPTNEVFAYHRLLAHRRKKAYQADPLPIVNRPDGFPCASAAEMQEKWRQHFGDLEAGQATPLQALADDKLSVSASDPAGVWPHPLEATAIPTFGLVLASIISVPRLLDLTTSRQSCANCSLRMLREPFFPCFSSMFGVGASP